MALTRVRNNQVYNSDINAATKLQPASITGGLLASNFTYSGNLTVGNLTVNGLTTTVDTTNLVIADPLVVVNRNQSGSPSYDLGFIFGRGNQTNTAIIWEEAAQQFQLQYTTESTAGTTFGTINNSGFANLQVYGLAAGNATITSVNFTNATLPNVRITGGYIDGTAIGATTPNTVVATSVTTSSGGQITGYLTGAIGANSANTGAFSTLTTTGTIISQGTITGAGQVIAYFNGRIGANTANAGTFTTVTTSGNLYSAGNIIAASGTASTTITTGALVVTGGTGISGQLIVGTGLGLAGNGTIYTSSTTATVFNTISTTVNAFGAATTASIGATTGTTTINNNLKAPSFTASAGGNIAGYFIGAIGANTANSGAFTTVTTTGGIALNTNASIVTDQTTASIFNSNVTTINLGQAATTINMGLNGASSVYVAGTANSYGSGAGALQITGGFYAGGDSYIAGNLVVANLTSLGYTALSVNSPMVYLDATGITNYNYEIGFYSHKYDAIEGYNHTGLLRNHIDNAWYFFSNLRSEPTGSADLANSYLIYDTVKVGNLIALSGNAATSTTTGALVISGGAGISGSLYAGSIQNTPIGSTTASTGAFTTITTTSTINSQGTVSAPTVNAGTFGNSGAVFTGASQTLTGNINALNFNGGNAATVGYLIANSGTNSTSTGTGALQVQGGVGVTGNIYLGSNVFAGTLSYSDLNIKYVGQQNYNGYIQNILQNTNNGSSASSDLIVNNDQSTASTYYGDFGINSSGFSGSGSLNAPNNVYLTATSSDLVLGTTTSNAIRFVINGGTTDSLIIDTNGNVVVQDNTASTSSNTGAFVVQGGAGIVGSIYSGANITAATATIAPTAYASSVYPYANTGDISVYTVGNSNLNVNFNQLAANLVVHGASASGYQHLLVTNGVTGQVGIKIAPNQITGNASLQINSTDSIILPSGSTAQRPSNGVAGMFRYNNNTNQLEYYSAGSSSWVSSSGAYTTVSEDSFTGDGSTVAFTLSQSGTTNSVIVSVNGLVQIPITAYSVSGTTLTFTEAPLATDIIDARTIVSTSVVTSIATGTSVVGLQDSGAGTGNAYINTNGTYRYIANTATGGSNYFRGGIAPMMNPVSLTSNANTIVDSFSASTFTGAKYLIKLKATSGAIQNTELLVVSNATVSNYSVVSNVYIGAGVATVGANVSGGTVYIVAQASTSGATATFMPTYMPI